MAIIARAKQRLTGTESGPRTGEDVNQTRTYLTRLFLSPAALTKYSR
ncbi:hypothetical protein [Streptomyces sp. bgisy027]